MRIVQMLTETGGNKLETAKRLGIGRQTLYNKIKAYGIEVWIRNPHQRDRGKDCELPNVLVPSPR